jgi:hypothetical protein
MRSYHFDLGNSTKGCLSLCARVVADSKRDAVRLLKDAFENMPIDVSFEWESPYQGTIELRVQADAVEYVHVYLNLSNLMPRHIDDGEEVENEAE